VGKGKTRKFEELKSFGNVFQPAFEDVFNKDFGLKNRWTGEHFRNKNPLILELGCGKGEYSVGLAKLFPQKNFIGVDIKGARIWTGAKKAFLEKIPNVAFVRTRIEFIGSFFGKNEVDEIWLTFPDPQLKKRRNKKRLSAARFLNLYRGFLKEGGIIHLKTDNGVLYNYTLELLHANGIAPLAATTDLYGNSQADLVYGIRTFYEEKFIEEGLNIHYLKFELPQDREILEPEIPEGD
jgi:tRNA (guanine-N7-)-methyltransferase